MVSECQINNWADDNNDLIRKSGVNFDNKGNFYTRELDYCKEIMQLVNYLITLPYQTHKKYPNFTNYKYFRKVITKIFGVVYKKSSHNDDIQAVIREDGDIDTSFTSKSSLTE